MACRSKRKGYKVSMEETMGPIGNSRSVPDKRTVSKVPGRNFTRAQWTTLIRIRTGGQGRCNYLHHKWGMAHSPFCECDEIQTITHIVPSGVLALSLKKGWHSCTRAGTVAQGLAQLQSAAAKWPKELVRL